MDIRTVTDADRELIEAARNIIVQRYEPGQHSVGAALRTQSGRIITGVHLEVDLGRAAVCAEAVALGRAITEGEKEFETIVAVRPPRGSDATGEVEIVPPCGMCRELLSQYGKNLQVIIDYEGEVVKCSIADLLPVRYRLE